MPRKGQHVSEETRAKIAMALLGKNCGKRRSPEAKEKNAVAHRGKKASPETRAKMSEAHSHCSSKTRARRSAAMRGRKCSPETRAKISATEKGKLISPETRAKIWKGGRKVSHRKSKAKRRNLGYVTLNRPFVGCEAHHLNKDFVVHIPARLHKSIRHNVWTGKNMGQINRLALEWVFDNPDRLVV